MSGEAEPRLVLGSSSPRRAALLSGLGLRFAVRPPDVPETLEPGELPAVAARRLATEKARAVPRDADEVVIAADTIVALGDESLGKPTDAGAAVRMLLALAGREHEVFTGVAVARGDAVRTGVERTMVTFRPLARSECAEYVATGEPLDKAGAYAIQGRGAALVERIDGDYSNVVGLPVRLLLTLLARHGLRYDFAGLRRGLRPADGPPGPGGTP
ncbi:MAG: Maf family protein [Gemmatimonadota bacterium]|nr:Maf family protein [Gemmatimonadota bacterium]